MDKQRVFRRSLIAAATAMALCGGSAIAQTVTETEPNNEVSEAQAILDGPGSVTVNAIIGTIGGSAFLDVDFYSFVAEKDDIVTIDIDGGFGGLRDVDTFLTLYTSAPWVLTTNDDIEGGVADTGSVSSMDAYIGNFPIPATGTYYVAVSSFPVTPDPDGTYSKLQAPGEMGDYSLTITLTRAVAEPAPIPEPTPVPLPTPDPVVQPASIEIKAGELIRGSRREILVALLSSPDFDPRNVDVASLTFALGNGRADGFKRCSKHGWRINRDNRRDLVCHFSTDVNVPAGEVDAVVKGKMKVTGTAFEGKGKVKVIDRHAGRRDRDRDHDRDGRRGRDRD